MQDSSQESFGDRLQPHFPLRQNVDCDFVVFAELNRGFRDYRRLIRLYTNVAVKAPRFFVFPAKILDPLVKVSGRWSKLRLSQVPNHDGYIERWDLIRKFLKLPPVAAPEEA